MWVLRLLRSIAIDYTVQCAVVCYVYYFLCPKFKALILWSAIQYPSMTNGDLSGWSVDWPDDPFLQVSRRCVILQPLWSQLYTWLLWFQLFFLPGSIYGGNNIWREVQTCAKLVSDTVCHLWGIVWFIFYPPPRWGGMTVTWPLVYMGLGPCCVLERKACLGH